MEKVFFLFSTYKIVYHFKNGHFADGGGGPSGDGGGSQEAAWSPDSEEAQEQGKRNYALRESESDLDKEHGLRETLTLTFTHTFSRWK